jgi:hypothetical protein
MKELELKHIVGYLPYNLKAESEFGNMLIESVLIGHLDFKPYLYSIECLIEEIEHNGEKIVPIVELAKVIEPKCNTGAYSNTDDNYCYWVDWYKKRELHTFIVYPYKKNKPLHFSYRIPFDGRFIVGESFTLALLDKLYSMHIDIHGLIPQGLAIDKRTI